MPNNKFAKLPKPQKQFLRSFFQPAATSYLTRSPLRLLNHHNAHPRQNRNSATSVSTQRPGYSPLCQPTSIPL